MQMCRKMERLSKVNYFLVCHIAILVVAFIAVTTHGQLHSSETESRSHEQIFPTTSTKRPWPSNKFLRKVIEKSKHSSKTGNTMFKSHPPPISHNTSKPTTLRSHSSSKRNNKNSHVASPPSNYQNKLDMTSRGSETRLTVVSDLGIKNQSGAITHPSTGNMKRRQDLTLITRSQNDHGGETMDKDDHPAVKNKNYGVGFQYEISSPIEVEKPSLPKSNFSTSFNLTISTTASSINIMKKIGDPVTNIPETSDDYFERFNPWKKLPVLTVTIHPMGETTDQAVSESTKRPKLNKRPKPHKAKRPIHTYYPKQPSTTTQMPIMRFPSSPPQSTVTTSPMLEFDFPFSPSPDSLMLNLQNQQLSQNHELNSRPIMPPPFSPFNEAVTSQRPHLGISGSGSHFFPDSHKEMMIKQGEIAGIQASTSSSSFSLQRPFTNIWYKPIINHFISAVKDLNKDKDTRPTNELPTGLIFKVWSYKNGKLSLITENLIPAEAVEGFHFQNGDIVNLEQIPQSVQSVVASAISEFNLNHNTQYQQGADLNFNLNPTFKTLEENENYDKPFVNYVIVHRENFSEDDIKDASSYPSYRSSTPSSVYEPGERTSAQPSNPMSLQHLHDLIMSVQKIKLPTPVQDDKVSVSSESNFNPDNSDSFQPEKNRDKQLLADLASAAILISYLRGAPKNSTTTSETPTTTMNSDQVLATTAPLTASPGVVDAPNIYVFLLSQLKNLNATTTSLNKSHLETKDRYLLTTTTTKSPHLETTTKPPKEKSLLLVKGMVKKGVKKKMKKKIKKKIKKGLLEKIVKPVAHIFKKPKEYWFDVKFDLDIYDIMKKKFLYYLALKYMPVVFVVALKLVPLALLSLPLLYKIYWVKKKPKYIKVPVPYPVYKVKYLPKPDLTEPGHGWNDDHDHDADHNSPMGFAQKHPDYLPPSPPFLLKTPMFPLDPYPHQSDANIDRHQTPIDLRPQQVSHAYDLGFNLGSKLNHVEDDHDREVLKILIEDKKKRVKKLLEKWKLFKTPSSSNNEIEGVATPIKRLGQLVSAKQVASSRKDNDVQYRTFRKDYSHRKRRRLK